MISHENRNGFLMLRHVFQMPKQVLIKLAHFRDIVMRAVDVIVDKFAPINGPPERFYPF